MTFRNATNSKILGSSNINVEKREVFSNRSKVNKIYLNGWFFNKFMNAMPLFENEVRLLIPLQIQQTSQVSVV